MLAGNYSQKSLHYHHTKAETGHTASEAINSNQSPWNNTRAKQIDFDVRLLHTVFTQTALSGATRVNEGATDADRIRRVLVSEWPDWANAAAFLQKHPSEPRRLQTDEIPRLQSNLDPEHSSLEDRKHALGTNTCRSEMCRAWELKEMFVCNDGMFCSPESQQTPGAAHRPRAPQDLPPVSQGPGA